MRTEGNKGYKSKNLYIADADVETWQRAEAFAKENGISVSSYVAMALEYTLRTGKLQRATMEEA